ncbi:arylsulfotransferase family protein [Shewanella eurypsychrophilus]|uniref:Arylsulfotransferase family protein n=1 Tax=Shewanella eurypsychrophilus TaxID=2593656 RepID=A0ABX6V6K7_9GAMM|nr:MULTISPECIES: arylsulfotransferase family protein [Shewanella]QPG58250.2 arylsulfotransferase family protein [Shewanella eurypsychrophilus]
MTFNSLFIARALFTAAILSSCFLLGGLFALNQWQPYTFIIESIANTQGLWSRVTDHHPRLLEPKVYAGSGVEVYDSTKAFVGYTLLQGTMPGGPQVKLIDMTGKELHRWNINFFRIWPQADHLAENLRPTSEFYTHTQGFIVFPDGSIIINIGGKGSAKLDKCSNVLWTLDRRTHHSITQTVEGQFWIPAHRNIDMIPEHLLFAGITKEKLNNRGANLFFGYENLVLLIDENGNTIREFSILESIYNAGLESAVLNSLKSKPYDITHINDIDVVTEALAQKIAGVNVGDLLISIRQMHMLAIIDQFTGKLKWKHIGPWVSQHDPDITEDGNITIFNNSVKELAFARAPGSNIIEFDPMTNISNIIYPTRVQDAFFSKIMGNHQALPNGNRLITESLSGRVFEINHDGEIIWQIIIPYDEDLASLIAISHRVSTDYFKVKDWDCSKHSNTTL